MHALLQDEQSAYAQLTVRIRALHRFAAYSGKGELKAGSPGKNFPVQDVWILERAFRKGPTSRWRIAGALTFGCSHHPANVSLACLDVGLFRPQAVSEDGLGEMLVKDSPQYAGRLSLPPVPPTKGSWWNPMTWMRTFGPSTSTSVREKPKLEARSA